MPKKYSYDTLWNMYNVAIAKAQDLQEQLTTKQQQWEKRDKDFANLEKVVRELCESILMKDPNEMVLGTDYSWRSIPTQELVLKSKQVFRKYVEEKKDLLCKILDESEERQQIIVSLKDQISELLTSPASRSITQEELAEKVEKEKKEKEVVATLPPKEREKVNDGDIKISIATDEHDDFDFVEDKIYKDMAATSAKTQITPKSIPVSNHKKKADEKRKRKAEADSLVHMVDLKEVEAKIDSIGWTIIEVIGAKGVSIYSDIEKCVFEKDPTITNNKTRVTTGLLSNLNVLSKESITNPLKGNLYVYSLSEMGSRIYKDKFGTSAKTSEMELIKAEHDNCTHGYGIKFVAEELRDSDNFKEVLDCNRKNPIKISEGISYIPDIICIDSNDAKMYIEYECVNHTSTDFYAKCNKMCKVTHVLNFITPNDAALNKLMVQVNGWINNRGIKSLSHIIIRITTAIRIKDKDLNNNKSWKIVYQPGKRKEPYVNF